MFRIVKNVFSVLALSLLLTSYAVRLGNLAAQPLPVTDDRPLQERLTGGKIRHDVWVQGPRTVNGILKQLRTPRLNSRLQLRRTSQNFAGTTALTENSRPTVTPDESNGLNPCFNPVLHRYYSHSRPVRAGPLFLS